MLRHALRSTKYRRYHNFQSKETLVHRVRNYPVETYSTFYKNQFAFLSNDYVISQVINDLERKLSLPLNIFNLNQFVTYKNKLQQILKNGRNLQNDPQKMYEFVIDYTEVMYALVKLHDTDIGGTYHSNFTKDFLKLTCQTGKNTQLFFTTQDVNYEYFIDIRATCIYLVHLTIMPDFNMDTTNYSADGKLVNRIDIAKHVEGKYLDFMEMLFHDIGHAYVMNRQDAWLFANINRPPMELVEEWIRNKNSYKHKIENLNFSTFKLAVKLLLFDIVHDRGYQFYLAILKQQLRATKNLMNIKTKILRGDFEDIVGNKQDAYLQSIDHARNWLLKITDELIIKDNFYKINKYRDVGYVIKKYPDIESARGVPVKIIIESKGIINVYFDCNGVIKRTCLYEIELLGKSVSKSVLTSENRDIINQQIRLLDCNKKNIELDAYGRIANSVINRHINKNSEKSDYDLKNIEVYKLERVMEAMRSETPTNFSITSLPTIYTSNHLFTENNNIELDDGTVLALNDVSIECPPRNTLKYININSHCRFVNKNVLRSAYIVNPNSLSSKENPYVTLDDSYELGIVDTRYNKNVALAISSLLTRSIEKASDVHGGYLPDGVVKNAQLSYVSPDAISNLWGKTGYRFVLSRTVNNDVKEIVGTALISSRKDNLFFFTSRYHNIAHSSMMTNIDFDLDRWFDNFALPPTQSYKPQGLNQIANFSIDENWRNNGLSKFMLTSIIKNYAVQYILANGGNLSNLSHSQYLICGDGLFQIADPSWLSVMQHVGLQHRYGAESFYVNPTLGSTMNGKQISNVRYNEMCGLNQIYENFDLVSENYDAIHMICRIPEVLRMSKNETYKLQYFQLYGTFDMIMTK